MGRPTKFDGMMHEVSAGMGFCGGVVDDEPRHVIDYIPLSGVVTADQFASWVLEAEGMSSERGDPFWSDLRAVFIKHMGSEAIGAEALKGGLYR